MTKLVQDAMHTWWNGPEVAYHDGRLYYGHWTTRARPAVTMVDLATGESQTTLLSLAAANVNDDHNNPAVIVLNSGRILAAWSQHNGDSFAVTSVTPYALDFAAPVQTYDGVLDTYVHLWQAPTGEVYEFFRRIENDEDRVSMFRVSSDEGATWGTDTAWLDAAAHRTYIRFVPNDTNPSRLDFFFNEGLPSVTVNSLYHGYMLIAADGTRTWHESDGTLAGDDDDIPFGVADFTEVYDGATSECWLQNCYVYDGLPAAVFQVYVAHSTANQEYHRAVWNGSAWSTEKICNAGTTAVSDLLATGTNYAGGVCLDPRDSSIAYASREYSASDFRLERFQRQASGWVKAGDVSGATGNKNFRPIAIDCGGTTRVVYLRGEFDASDDYAASLHVWPKLDNRQTAKPANPVVSAGFLPYAADIFIPFTEGAGTPADITGNYTIAASSGFEDSEWKNSRRLGPSLKLEEGEFLSADAYASQFVSANGPLWFAVMLTSTSTVQQYVASFGASGSDTPVAALAINRGAAGTVSMFTRDNAGNSTVFCDIAGTNINDGQPHVLMGIKAANNLQQVYLDGVPSAVETTSHALTAFNQCTVGALRRTTVTSPFKGEILAFAAGTGGAPAPYDLWLDWSSGRFSGVKPSAVTAVPSGPAELPAPVTLSDWVELNAIREANADARFEVVDGKILQTHG